VRLVVWPGLFVVLYGRRLGDGSFGSFLGGLFGLGLILVYTGLPGMMLVFFVRTWLGTFIAVVGTAAFCAEWWVYLVRTSESIAPIVFGIGLMPVLATLVTWAVFEVERRSALRAAILGAPASNLPPPPAPPPR